MTGGGRSRLLLAAAAAVAVAACRSAEQYPVPPSPLVPAVVGVIRDVTFVDPVIRYTLDDGRTFDASPHASGFRWFGSNGKRGSLLVARPGSNGFGTALDASSPGCWEAWQAPSDTRIVWDDGASVLFPTGIELKKAVRFHATPSPRSVEGHQAWTISDQQVAMSFCANEDGLIEFAEPQK